MSIFKDIYFSLATYAMIGSYLLGSISFGILITKFMKLGNLRSFGSGNIGATNVLRTGNKIAAALTVILDAGKGYLAIYVTTSIFENNYLLFAGIAVFLGHIFPIYHNFKGGKGVATFIGIILAIDLNVGLATCGCWLGTALIFKKSSLASLSCSTLTPIFLLINRADEKVVFALILAILIWWLHKENIKRLILKTEPSINFTKKRSN